jgi:uncharacterized protein
MEDLVMNNNIPRGMKCLLYLFGLLAISVQALAASFDCAKAQTTVEHLICNNPDISKLDEELSAAYKAALQDEKRDEAIKLGQKQWMKERNSCSDAACVQSAYRKRIEQLHLSQNSNVQVPSEAPEHVAKSGVTSADNNTTPKKFPPYPDVWDWVLPNRDLITEHGVDLFGMETGDILLSYLTRDKNGKYTVVKPTTLFGHLVTSDDVATIRSRSNYQKVLPKIKLSDGTTAQIESVEETRKLNLQRVPLAGGRKLYQTSFTPIGPTYSSCYFGPAHFLYGITGPDRKQIKGVVIFKLLDKPKRIDIKEGCASESMQTFTTRVESIDAGLRARPLADGGFVMEVDKGVLIRFDKDFNSRSQLLNDRYFVLDDTGADALNIDGWIYVDRITGKTYRKSPTDVYEYQSVVDDLYKHLIYLKSKKGAAK